MSDTWLEMGGGVEWGGEWLGGGEVEGYASLRSNPFVNWNERSGEEVVLEGYWDGEKAACVIEVWDG